MNATQLSEFLEKHRACEESKEWAKGKSLAQCWAECDNPWWIIIIADWLIKEIPSHFLESLNLRQFEGFDRRKYHTRYDIIWAIVMKDNTTLSITDMGLVTVNKRYQQQFNLSYFEAYLKMWNDFRAAISYEDFAARFVAHTPSVS